MHLTFRSLIPLLLLCFTSLVTPFSASAGTSATVVAGQAVTLSVTSDGTSPFTYQWYRNSQLLGGATGASYVIASAQPGDAGSYHAVVANSAGSTTSDVATLSVSVAPSITSQPAGQSVVAGGTATFSVTASGSPAPTFQWQQNGQPIPGATAATLVIAGVTAGDAATYSVVASNSAGSVTSAGAVLVVQVPPVFTTQPASQTIAAGSPVTFTVVASGTPAPTYQWRKNGVSIPGATGTTYTIASVSTSDVATYSAVATNAAGSATSAGATLSLRQGPVIVTHPVSQTVAFKDAVTLSVTATGSGRLSYQWFKDGSPISKATASTYRITRMTSGNEGVYWVTVTDSQGSSESGRALVVMERTPPPLAVRVDFNRDGHSDIVVQNAATGERMIWLMRGTRIATAEDLGVGPVEAEIAGSGDFNGDGHSDLIWQDRATGERWLQQMSGTSELNSVSLGQVATQWDLVGAGEFNGDNTSDLVWQNRATGERRLWLMNGTTPGQQVSLGTVTVDWEIRGTGDFNNDRRSDLVWQNRVTGECRIWLMAGTSVASVVSLGRPGPGWELAGCGDFNGDANSDLIWENAATGERMIQLMVGTSPGELVSLGMLTPDWFIRN